MLIWDSLKILALVAAFCNPSSVYIATRQLHTLTLTLVDEVRTHKRSVLSLFPQIILVTGRLIVLFTLIVANCVLVETIGDSDNTVTTTAKAISEVQQLAKPLPSTSLNAVVECVKEKIDLPVTKKLISNTDKTDVMIDQPPPPVSTTILDESTEADSDDGTLENCSEGSLKAATELTPERTALNVSQGKKGNPEPECVSVDTTKVKITPSSMHKIDGRPASQNITNEQQPEATVPPEIDGRQQSRNQLKRQSLLLPKLNPPRQSIEKPHRKFSLSYHRSNDETDSKPKRFLSIFKKKN
jgi:hypothetical protein